ncbi:hypothetical protein TNCV_3954951 [Trichonephila clavipes]|nr:hypothetical protein TNCV_3954951 [Trichonephila clavipes]
MPHKASHLPSKMKMGASLKAVDQTLKTEACKGYNLKDCLHYQQKIEQITEMFERIYGLPDLSFFASSSEKINAANRKIPKRKAVEPPPEETDSEKCRRHQEMQKRIKMANGILSFLEHCIRSEKEFPDLTDDDALVGLQKEHEELSAQQESKPG